MILIQVIQDSAHVAEKIAQIISEGIIIGANQLNHNKQIINGVDNSTTNGILGALIGGVVTLLIKGIQKRRKAKRLAKQQANESN